MKTFHFVTFIYIGCICVAKGQFLPPEKNTSAPVTSLTVADLLEGMDHSGFTASQDGFHGSHGGEGGTHGGNSTVHTHGSVSSIDGFASTKSGPGLSVDNLIGSVMEANPNIPADGLMRAGTDSLSSSGSRSMGSEPASSGDVILHTPTHEHAHHFDGLAFSNTESTQSSDGFATTNTEPVHTSDGFGTVQLPHNEGFFKSGVSIASSQTNSVKTQSTSLDPSSIHSSQGIANTFESVANTGDGFTNTGTSHSDGFTNTGTSLNDGFTNTGTSHSDGFTNTGTSLNDGFTNTGTSHSDGFLSAGSRTQAGFDSNNIVQSVAIPETPVANGDGILSMNSNPMPSVVNGNNRRLRDPIVAQVRNPKSNLRKPMVVEVRNSRRNEQSTTTGQSMFDINNRFDDSPRRSGPSPSAVRNRVRDRHTSAEERNARADSRRRSFRGGPRRQLPRSGSRTMSNGRNLDRLGMRQRQDGSRTSFDFGPVRDSTRFEGRFNPRDNVMPTSSRRSRFGPPLPLVSFGDSPRITIGSMGSGSAGSSPYSSLLPGPTVSPFSSDSRFSQMSRGGAISPRVPSFGFDSVFPSSGFSSSGSTPVEPFGPTAFSGLSRSFSPMSAGTSPGSFMGGSPFFPSSSGFGSHPSRMSSFSGGSFPLSSPMSSPFTEPGSFSLDSSRIPSSHFMSGFPRSSVFPSFGRGHGSFSSFGSRPMPFSSSMVPPLTGSSIFSGLTLPSSSIGSFGFGGHFGSPGSVFGSSFPALSSPFASTFGSSGRFLF